MSSKNTSEVRWGNFENALFVYPALCFIVYIGSDLITDQVASVFHYSWIAALFLSVWIVASQILKLADDATRIRSAYNRALLEQPQSHS